MGTSEIVTWLIAERDKIERAIQALGTPVKRRGRPPKAAASLFAAPAALVAPAKRARKRKPMSAAQKKAHSARMKAYWAAKRKK